MTRILFTTEPQSSPSGTENFRHRLTQFVSTNYFSNNFVYSKQRLCSKQVFVPAGLLCLQAEKISLVETKHGFLTAFTKAALKQKDLTLTVKV